MLLSAGSEIIRLQSPLWIHRSWIELLISLARSGATILRICFRNLEGEDEGGASTVDLSERDALFEEAAKLIVHINREAPP